ncbi:MAG: hypothetical protein ISS69_05560 [Phycisphaerae bacterium]|nr:hypothetical protein [Phycisphaerae bacterium]
MSILTKICVVLVLVVSVAASGVFLRLVSVQRNWKGAYFKQKDRADVADITAANVMIALQKKVAELATALEASRTQQKALADEQTLHAADKAKAAQALATQIGQYDVLNASLTELAKDLEASLAMQKQLTEDKAALTKAVESANEVARGLKKDYDEASVQIKRLEAMTRHYALLIKDLRAENKVLQTEIADLRSKGATVAGGDSGVAPVPVTAPGQAVSGKITAVHDGVASINIGRAKGIKEKMILKVFRSGKFVSHLRIDLVEPDSAAGVILNKKLDVIQGDEVATDLK